MMNDLELAKEQARKYDEWQKEKGIKTVTEFDIKILTTSYWPTYASFELSVPPEIKQCMDNFTEFYTA